jgi:bifunctional non-homologous end joining protein LigD
MPPTTSRRVGGKPARGAELDPAGLPGARPVAELPRFVQPEMATLVEEAPRGDDWSHEVKFDGYRTLARIENGAVEMRSRNDKDWTGPYQVVADELAALPVRSAMLDGEVVVRLPDGTTSFEELRRVLGRGVAPGRGGADGGAEGASGRAADDRLVYYVFDLLYLDGFELLGAGLEERRALLKRLLAQAGDSTRILFSDAVPGDGPAVLAQACRLGLEGVVSKKASTRYRPGTRGPDWVKSKCRHEQEFVIGGFTDPGGSRPGFGALLLGVHGPGGLRYVSKVGTGFAEGDLRLLAGRLRALEIDHPPFDQDLARMPKAAHWVRPELLAEVAFMEWTSDGGLRHPSFKGLRDDKTAVEAVAERPQPAVAPGP